MTPTCFSPASTKLYSKRHITLLEVCISLGLMSTVIYFLFSSFLGNIRLSHRLDKIKPYALQRSAMYERMVSVFSKTDAASIQIPTEKESPFLLSLSFENGVDPTMSYSGTVKADLSLEGTDLILQIWPITPDTPPLRHTLLSHVESLSIEANLPFFLTLTVNESDQFAFFLPNRPQDALIVKPPEASPPCNSSPS